MSDLLFNRAFSEHCKEDVSYMEGLSSSFTILFQQKEKCKCIEIIQENDFKNLYSSYYIGVDWLIKN